MGREEPVVPAEKVRSERRGGIAIISIDNPPAAALSSEVRTALSREIEAAASDADVAGVVLSGSAQAFATGGGVADQADGTAPALAALCDRIEALAKPVVAAIAGPALGGGLELALAAHLRIAAPSARLGSPEITLGLVPNAGGTQRLPKVVGGVVALKLLLSGRAVDAAAAQKLGLVDAVETGDLVDAAATHARRLAGSTGELRRSSLRRDRLGGGTAFLEAVAAQRKLAEASPLEAPLRLIECVEAALLLPYEIGRGLEQAAYEDLVESEHSKSLRHVFAAERLLQAATRWEGRVPSRPLNGVAVIGAQAISAEVAVLCLDAGFKVTVAEENDEALERGVARIIEHFDARVAAGAMSEAGVEKVLDRMTAVIGLENVAGADVVLDPFPVSTRPRVAALDAAMRAGAVLALGAEHVDIGTLAAMTSRPADVVGLRFFPGPRRNRLVEMAAGPETGPRAIATARALARKLDRLIVDTGAGRDSIGTRVAEALHAAADLCLEDGGRVSQIDAALRDWGLPFGSFAWRDIIGVNRFSAPRGREGQRGGGLDEVLAAAGRIGMAAGRGYYVYRERGKPGTEDPDVVQMVEADRLAKGIRPRSLSDGEVRMRCVAAMAGAGAHLLADGIAKRPSDIDMVAIHGLSFARRSGGVMFAADLLGLAQVRQILLDLSGQSARIQPPSQVFQDLIKAGEDFSSLNG